MGDNGQLYVPKELLHIYRDKLIPLADIVTPNQLISEGRRAEQPREESKLATN